VAEILLEYPEINIRIEGYAPKQRKTNEALALASARAEACREKLIEHGAVCFIELGSAEGRGGTRILAGPAGWPTSAAGEVRLLEPQQRLNRILSRASFDFLPQSAELSAKGQRVVLVCGHVLKEAQHQILIACPRKSSSLALRRAEALAQAFREQGVPKEIKVQLAFGAQERTTVLIDSEPTDAQEQLSPTVLHAGPQQLITMKDLQDSSPAPIDNSPVDAQEELERILKETPLCFRADAPSELVPEGLSVVRRCAGVLKQVQCSGCMIEAYSKSLGAVDFETSSRLREMMRERAERVVDWLQAEGVTVPLYAKGHCGNADMWDDDSPEEHRGSGTGSHVIVTLLQPGRENVPDIDLLKRMRSSLHQDVPEMCCRGGLNCL